MFDPYQSYSPQFARIFEATQCRTQTQLAEMLGVKQSCISDAKRRDVIPSSWLITLWRCGINPDWIITGEGPRLIPTHPTSLDSEILSAVLACIPKWMLAAEMGRRLQESK